MAFWIPRNGKPMRVPKYQELYLKILFFWEIWSTVPSTWKPSSGSRSWNWNRNLARILFLATQESMMTCPRWQKKIYLTMPECSDMHTTEIFKWVSGSWERNPHWVLFSGIRKPIVTWLKMKWKVQVTSSVCLEIHRNKMSSGFRS